MFFKRIVCILSLLQSGHSFINPIPKRTVHKYLPVYNQPPSEIVETIGVNNPLGDPWSYSDLIYNANHKLIDSATLITNNDQVVGIYSIDNKIVNSQVESYNIHTTKIIPSLVDSVVSSFNHAGVRFDILDATSLTD